METVFFSAVMWNSTKAKKNKTLTLHKIKFQNNVYNVS